MASTARLTHVNECRGYLWGRLVAGGSILGGIAGSGNGDRICGTEGGTLRGAWGQNFLMEWEAVLPCGCALGVGWGLVLVCQPLQNVG